MTLCEKIVEIRKSKGITQKKLSELTGIPLTTLSRYEKTGNIKSNNLHKIANALGVSLPELLGYTKTNNEDLLSRFSIGELMGEIIRRSGE